ncbi:hypothetical protein [Bacteroides caecimuris]|uniref:hypothetical protein n=1 Tax=Bacteroides caecimuris TaxID=1796613 RepID=UPI0026597CD0|nr:hypothetical protein [Bacteroides caecimuris]
MKQETTPKENPYNNEVAFKDLLKMMGRKDLITASFVLDRYGYESFEVESRVMDKFIIQLSNELFGWIFKYLLFGNVEEPTPSPTAEDLIISSDKDTNEFSTDILRSFIKDPKERPHMHIVPEVIDKPDRLTVTFAYPYGVIVFKVTRTQEMGDFLETQGF